MPPTRRIVDRALHIHFVAFLDYRGRPLLGHDPPKRIGQRVLGIVQERTGALGIDFVFASSE
ncbi:hypothetical protein [Planctellipticum variicoloris]|uniref:hypothetical protein n=1 Tax=Planctellipticum variicoloris TaxID=3064265 RepID=UPI003013D452|nr:hypothetical protein SH412_001809 [Planctomycetaceae bacterium SH412]